VVGGAVCIAVGARAPEELNYEQLVAKFGNHHFVVFAVVIGVSMVLSLIVVGGSFANMFVGRIIHKLVKPMLAHYEQVTTELGARVDELTARVAQLESQRDGGVPTALRHRTDSSRERSSRRLLADMHARVKERTESEQKKSTHKDPYVYAACAGIIGAVSVLLGGVVSRIFMLSFAGDGGDTWKEWYTYIFIVLLLCTIAAQTAFLNAGMERGDVMAVYPVFQAFWIGFGTVGSVFLFWRNGRHFTAEQDGLYTGAVVLMLIGVRFLFKHQGTGTGDAGAAREDGGELAVAVDTALPVSRASVNAATGAKKAAAPGAQV